MKGKKKRGRGYKKPTLRQQRRAVLKIQCAIRRRKARKVARLLVRVVFKQVYDVNTGRLYYFNQHSKETHWKQPFLLEQTKESFEDIGDDIDIVDCYAAYTALCSSYELIADKESKGMLYKEIYSGRVMKKKPKCIEKLQYCLQQRKEQLGVEWEELFDDTTGKSYYLHKPTDRTQWKRPLVDFRQRKKKRGESSESNTSDSKEFTSDSEPPELVKVKHESDSGSDLDFFNESSCEEFDTFQASHSLEAKTELGLSGETRDDMNLKVERMRKLKARYDSLLAAASTDERQVLGRRAMIRRLRRTQVPLLSFRSCGLGCVPEELFRATKKYNLSQNAVSSEDDIDFVRYASCIKELDFSENSLRELPKRLKVLFSSLKVLNLSKNVLKALPVQLFYLCNLERLDVSHNLIESIPSTEKEVEIFRDIQMWDLNISNVTQLKVLNGSYNRFSALPADLGNLQNLEFLSFAHNAITAVPEELANLACLTELHLSHNKIEVFMVDCNSLEQLVVLDLSHNELTLLSSTFDKLSRLEALFLHNNMLDKISEQFGMSYREMRRLTLQSNKLHKLPESMNQMSQLISLDISNNQLSELPENLFGEHLAQLQCLNVSRNQLTIMRGETILPTLVEINIANNKLESIPWKLLGSATLQVINVSFNCITEIPEQLFVNLSRTAIEALHFRSNFIDFVPATIRLISKVRYIDLTENKLQTLPSTITELKQLRYLGLRSNHLSRRQDLMDELPLLRSIDWSGNRMTSIGDSLTLPVDKMATVKDLLSCHDLSAGEKIHQLESLVERPVMSLSSEAAACYYALACTKIRMHDTKSVPVVKDILEDLKHCLRFLPNHSPSKYKQAKCMYLLGSYKKSMAIIDEMLSASEALPKYIYLRGLAALKVGATDKACEDFIEVAALTKDKDHHSSRKLNLHSLHHHAYVLSLRHKYSKANVILGEIISSIRRLLGESARSEEAMNQEKKEKECKMHARLLYRSLRLQSSVLASLRRPRDAAEVWKQLKGLEGDHG